jgi:hypothetical protein
MYPFGDILKGTEGSGLKIEAVFPEAAGFVEYDSKNYIFKIFPKTKDLINTYTVTIIAKMPGAPDTLNTFTI